MRCRRVLSLGFAVLSSLFGCATPADDGGEASEGALRQGQCSVLVVLSDNPTITAVGATPFNQGVTKDYKFGYLLDETSIPVRALVDAGCKVDFTTPTGVEPPRDPQGDNAIYFTDGLPNPGPDATIMDEAVALTRLDRLVPDRKAFAELSDGLFLVDSDGSPIRDHGPGSINTPLPFGTFVRDGNVDASKLSRYQAVFVPGGYSPMSLWNYRSLGAILRWFHRNDRLTVTLCRGGVALTSTTEVGDFEYRDYKMATYSTLEDNLASVVNGIKPLYNLPYHPSEKLKEAGAKVEVRPLSSLVVEDRDLLSGANQFSAHALASRFVGALTARGAIRR